MGPQTSYIREPDSKVFIFATQFEEECEFECLQMGHAFSTLPRP